MIPAVNEHGYLPPGIHTATLAEITDHFGTEPELRRVQAESLGWLLDAAWRAGVLRVVVNGSFTTDEHEPNDVDCALMIGTDYPADASADAELQLGMPFIHAEILTPDVFDPFIRHVFASDRRGVPKGVVEVLP